MSDSRKWDGVQILLDDTVRELKHLELPDVRELFLSLLCSLVVDSGLPAEELKDNLA